MSAGNDYWPVKMETMRKIEADLRAENERLRAVALAAKALVSQCADRGYHCETPEHKLCELESALEAAGYGMTDEEFERGVTDETREGTPPWIKPVYCEKHPTVERLYGRCSACETDSGT